MRRGLMLAAVGFCLAATDAQAQWGDFARKAIEAAARAHNSPQAPAQGSQAPAQGSAQPAQSPTPGGPTPAQRPVAPRPARRGPAADAPATGPEPWPINLETATGPRALKFAPETAAKKDAFTEFSAYRCNDCEGGRGYDAWVKQSLNMVGDSSFETKVGGMGVGQSLAWKGHGASGLLTVVNDTAIGPWPCKQVRYKLTRKSGETAERPGLFCMGRASDYAAHDSWIEVF